MFWSDAQVFEGEPRLRRWSFVDCDDPTMPLSVCCGWIQWVTSGPSGVMLATFSIPDLWGGFRTSPKDFPTTPRHYRFCQVSIFHSTTDSEHGAAFTYYLASGNDDGGVCNDATCALRETPWSDGRVFWGGLRFPRSALTGCNLVIMSFATFWGSCIPRESSNVHSALSAIIFHPRVLGRFPYFMQRFLNDAWTLPLVPDVFLTLT
jgi:hypothetical protein